MTRDEARAKLVELTGIVPHSLSLAARIEAAIDAFEEAALRVVPPEGGPRPITKEHLDVAIKAADADYQQTADWRMDAEHSDDLRRRSAMFAALTAVWALRASGAGTRQEEPE